MPGALKPRMITTKTGRLINSNFAGKQKPNGVISLEKSKGTAKQKTNRQIKEELKTYDKEKISSLIEESKKRYSDKLSILKIKHLLSDSRKLKNPAQFLLSKGIDARQLKAKGIPIYVIMDIFGLKEAVKLFKINEKKSGIPELYDRELNNIFDYYREKPGRSKVYKQDLIKEMVKEYGLKEMLDVFGLNWVVYGVGVRPVMKMYDIKEIAKVADFHKFVSEIGIEPTITAAGGLKAAAQLFKHDQILDEFSRKYCDKFYNHVPDYVVRDCPYSIKEFADIFGVKKTLNYWGLKATTQAFGFSKVSDAVGGHYEIERRYDSWVCSGRKHILRQIGVKEYAKANGGILKASEFIVGPGNYASLLPFFKEYSLKEIVAEINPRYLLKCNSFSELEAVYGSKEVISLLGPYLPKSLIKSAIVAEGILKGKSTKDITKEINMNKKK